MNVNLTIIIQIINFFVLYAFIRIVLIKPGARILLKEEQRHLKRLNEIQQLEKILAQYRLEHQQIWEQFHLFCAQKIPDITCVTRDVLPVSMPVIEPITFDKETIDSIVHSAVETLTNKIKVS